MPIYRCWITDEGVMSARSDGMAPETEIEADDEATACERGARDFVRSGIAPDSLTANGVAVEKIDD